MVLATYGATRVKGAHTAGDEENVGQTERIAYLWRAGYFTPDAARLNNFANMHLRRALDIGVLEDRSEEW